MRLLIDGDILVYRAAFAVQRDGEAEPLSHAKQAMRMLINNILYAIPHTSYDVYLSAEGKCNFRFEVAKTKPYKGNRKQPKPVHYNEMRLFLMKNYNATVVSDIEADDMLGIQQNENTCIVTLDKDLDMIPGEHYNFVQKREYQVNHTEAYRTFCKQLIVGDSVDNIAGIKGMGPVKASKALSWAGRDKAKMIKIVYDLYDNEELFLEMGKLVWIWRDFDSIFDPDLEDLQSTRVQYSIKHYKKDVPAKKLGETIDEAVKRSKE